MRKHILTIALTIAGLSLGTAYASPAFNATQAIRTVRGALIGHDSDGHRTLNEVALGVPLDDAMPACEGDPHKATSLCHTSLERPYDGAKELTADVYGFGVRKDDEGHPKVTSMVVTTSISSTVIKDVTAHIASASTYKTFLETSQVLGIPTLVEDDFTSWDRGRGPVVLLGTSFITLYQR